jgi:cytochrome P450
LSFTNSLTTDGDRGDPRALCPHLAGYDPLVPEIVADPFPLLSIARAEQPVFFLEKYDLWVVTRLDDVLAVYKNMDIFSSGSAHQPLMPKPQSVIDRVGEEWPLPIDGLLNSSDPPLHGTLRRTLLDAFIAAIRNLDPWIDQRLEEITNQIVHKGKADLVSEFAWPLTISTMARLVGAPLTEAGRFKEWAENWFELTGSSNLSKERAEACWMGFVDFEEYMTEMIAERRQVPRDDFLSRVIEAQNRGAAITDRQIGTNMLGFVAAGTDTTANTIAQMIHLLLTHPDQLAEVRRDPTLRPAMIEEVLRMRVPIRGVIRKTTRATKLGGVELPEGAHVLIHVGSACRDADKFADPEEFNIHRENLSKHAAFGAGRRMCIGAPLARKEIAKALDVLLNRFPDLQLAPEQGPLRYTSSIIVPSLKSLRITWTPPGPKA